MGAKLVKRSEMVDIFGESEVGKYKIKPWTVSQFIRLSPILKQVAGALKEQGFDISRADIEKISLSMDLSVGDVIGYLTTGIDIIGPVIPQFIGVSVRIEESEAEEIEWGPALALAAKIIVLNWDHIKNWYGQILGKDPKALFLAMTKKNNS